MLNPGAGALDPAAARGFAAYGNAGNMGQTQGNFPLGALQGGMQGAGINVRANLAGLQANAQAGLQANAQGRFAAAQLQSNLQNNLQNLQQQQLAGQFQRQGALNNANLGNGVLGGNAAAAAVAAGVRAGGALGGMNNPALTSIRPGVDRGGNIGLAGMGAAGVGQQNLGMQGFQQATLQQALQQANNQQQQAALQQRLAAGGIGLGQGNMQQMQQAQQNAARLQNMGVNMMQQGMPATNAQGQDLLAMLGRNKAAGQNVLGANNVEAYAALMKQQQQREQAQQAQQAQAQQAQAQQAQQQQQQQQQQGRPQGLPGGLQGGPGPGQDFNVNTEDFPALPGTGAPRGGDDGGGRGPYGSMQGNAAAVLGRGGYMLGGDQYGAGGLGDVARAQAAGLADYDAIIRFQQQQQQAQAAAGAAAAAQRPGVGKPGGLGGPMGAGPLGADGINGPGKAGIGAGAAQERMGPPPDKWGLLAIMPLLKMTDQDATTLELGINLTTLGLDLTSPSSLHKALVTPLSAHPIKAEPEFDLPACYKHIPQRLQPGYLSKFKDETLFYIFYSMPGDEAQLVAADELSVRNWSFHKRLRMWMTPDLQAPPPQKSARGERGTYVVFNPTAWQPEVKPDQEIFIDDWEQAPRLLRPQQRPPAGGPTGPGGPQQQAGPGGAPQAGPGQPPGPVAPVAR